MKIIPNKKAIVTDGALIDDVLVPQKDVLVPQKDVLVPQKDVLVPQEDVLSELKKQLQLVADRRRSKRAVTSHINSTSDPHPTEVAYLKAVNTWLGQFDEATKKGKLPAIAGLIGSNNLAPALQLDKVLIVDIKKYTQRLLDGNFSFSDFDQFSGLIKYWRDRPLGDPNKSPLKAGFATGFFGAGIGYLIAVCVASNPWLLIPAAVFGIIGAIIWDSTDSDEKQMELNSNLEKRMADYYRFNGAEADFFESELEREFEKLKDKFIPIERQLCEALDVDKVYLQLEIRSSIRTHEVAATLGDRKKPAPTGKIYTTALGIQAATAQLVFDKYSSELNLSGQGKRLLSFATLTSYIADETRTIERTGSIFVHEMTKMSLAYRPKLTISNTGIGNFIIDTGHLSHIYYGENDERKTLEFEINLGAGDGTAYLNAGKTTLNGDSRYLNHANYSNTPSHTKLVITADATKLYHYTVSKQINDQIWVEKFEKNTFQKYWRQNPIVETRVFASQRESYRTMDTLNNIHLITGSAGGTIFHGGEGNEGIILGHAGDEAYMHGGDDLIVLHTSLQANNHTLDGGSGQNTLHYATASLTIRDSHKSSIAKLAVQVKIEADGRAVVNKSREAENDTSQSLGTDSVRNFQNWSIDSQGKNTFVINAHGYFLKFSGTNKNQLDINGNQTLVVAEDGHNKITTASTTHHQVVNLRNGNNILALNSHHDHVTVGDGDNIFFANSHDSTYTFGQGHNIIKLFGTNNILTLASGKSIADIGGGRNIVMRVLGGWQGNSILGAQNKSSYTTIDYSQFVGETTITVTGNAILMTAGELDADLESGKVEIRFNANQHPSITLTDTVQANAIKGNANNNRLSGDEGDNTLDGVAGTNHLTGRQGNDTLYGGIDEDTYYYEKGDGQDKVRERGGRDKIVLKESRHHRFKQEEILLKREGNHFSINFTHQGSDGDKIVVEDFFEDKSKEVETLALARQDYDIAQLIQAAATMSPSSANLTSADISWSYSLQQLSSPQTMVASPQ